MRVAQTKVAGTQMLKIDFMYYDGSSPVFAKELELRFLNAGIVAAFYCWGTSYLIYLISS